MTTLVKLVRFDRVFLQLSWDWLNDSELKELTDTPDFTRESQQSWFDTLQKQTEYLIWGISFQNVRIGACGLKNFTTDDCEYWGYIGNKEYWGKGLGAEIMKLVEEEARSLNMHSLWLKVLHKNERAIRSYHKSGYTIEESMPSFLKMRKNI